MDRTNDGSVGAVVDGAAGLDVAQEEVRLLRRREVERRTSLSRSRLYALIADGAFPAPVRLGANSVAWVASEVDGWVLARIRERDGG